MVAMPPREQLFQFMHASMAYIYMAKLPQFLEKRYICNAV
jgi:hypothetical protein